MEIYNKYILIWNIKESSTNRLNDFKNNND